MKTIKRIISFSVVLILLLCMSVNSFAGNKHNLECGIEIEAELVENKLSISINNKTSKDIVTVKYAKEVFHNEEKFEGLIGIETIKRIYSDSNIVVRANEKAIVEQKSLYIPMNYSENGEMKQYSYSDISVNLYFYYVEFSDGSKWGDEYYNLDYVYNNIKPLDLQSSENQIDATEKNTFLKSDVLTLFKCVVVIAAIIILCKLNRISKKKGSFQKQKNRKKDANLKTISTGFVKQNQIAFSDKNSIKGFEGESEIANCIENSIIDEKYILRNVYITREDGKTAEIDIILIHKSGVYVIESKNYSGWVFGSEKDLYWTQSLYKGAKGTEKNKFYNPVTQNKNHVKYLKKYLGNIANNTSFRSIVIFGDNSELKDLTITSDDVYVIHSYQTVDTIKAFIIIAEARRKSLSSENMKYIFEKLYPLTQVSEEEKAKHINEINNMKNQNEFNSIAKSEGGLQVPDKTMNTDTNSPEREPVMEEKNETSCN